MIGELCAIGGYIFHILSYKGTSKRSSLVANKLCSLSHTNLSFLGGDGCVSVDEFGEYAAQCLNTQRQGCDVQEEHVSHVSGQHATLDGRSDGYGLVGVHRLTGRPTEQVLHGRLYLNEKMWAYKYMTIS